MDELLKGDKDLVSIMTKIDYILTMIYMLEEIIKAVNNRQWQIRSAVDYRRFQAGS